MPATSQTTQFLSDEEIAAFGARMRLADPEKDEGAFKSITRKDALIWLNLLGVSLKDQYTKSLSEDVIIRWLRYALWDSQRLENIFHGTAFSDSVESLKFDLQKFPTWPGWKESHPEFSGPNAADTFYQLDGLKPSDAAKLDSYVLLRIDLHHIFRRS
jgi:hypothetical protein